MAKGARSKALKRNNRAKREKIQKSEMLRNERIYAKINEIRKQSTLTELTKNSIQTAPTPTKLNIKIHDEATDENTIQTAIQIPDPTEMNEDSPQVSDQEETTEPTEPTEPALYRGRQALTTAGIRKKKQSRRRNINPKQRKRKANRKKANS